jgi:hypothetical protein
MINSNTITRFKRDILGFEAKFKIKDERKEVKFKLTGSSKKRRSILNTEEVCHD